MTVRTEMEKDAQQGGNTQHDLYLQEIEGIDDYWGPTFRCAQSLQPITYLLINIDKLM